MRVFAQYALYPVQIQKVHSQDYFLATVISRWWTDPQRECDLLSYMWKA